MSTEILKDIVGSALVRNEDDGIYYSACKGEFSYPLEGNDRSLDLEEFSFWFKHRNKCINSVVERFRPEDSVLFDVGGGNGYVSLGLKTIGIVPVVVEPMKSGASNARKRGIENVVCSALGDAGFEKGRLPSVGLFDVLEHVEDDAGFMREIRDYLNEGGYVYLTVPAYRFLWSRMDEIGGHYRRYTMKRLMSVCSSAGFEILFKSYIFWFLPIPMFFTRVLPERLGFLNQDCEVVQSLREHGGSQSVFGRILGVFCSWELSLLRARYGVPFGGSCLIVARKAAEC